MSVPIQHSVLYITSPRMGCPCLVRVNTWLCRLRWRVLLYSITDDIKCALFGYFYSVIPGGSRMEYRNAHNTSLNILLFRRKGTGLKTTDYISLDFVNRASQKKNHFHTNTSSFPLHCQPFFIHQLSRSVYGNCLCYPTY